MSQIPPNSGPMSDPAVNKNYAQASEPKRRDDIDWLRVLAMLVVFVFHCGRFFDEEDWHVKNPQTNHTVMILVGITVQWMMPLFFLLSGMSSCYALSRHKAAQYILARIKRLAVPFVFGTFVVIAPLQVYLERLSHGQFHGSFLEFYPHYFEGWYGLGGNFAWMGIHLWYLEILFIFSLVALPLFLYLSTPGGRKLISKIAVALKQMGFIFLLAFPIAIMEFVANLPFIKPTILGSEGFGGWSLLVYLVYFILGYLIAADFHLGRVIEVQRIPALIGGISITTVGFYLVESGYVFPEWLSALLRGFNAWAWLIAICGFGSRHLNFSNRFLKYGNEAVLPFYILHQTVILTIGYYIVQSDMAMSAKFLIIAVTSSLTIVALYEVLIRRVNLLRFLFGMKLKQSSLT